jgi:sulfopyruvate decarboxylase TPP-binding subunit
MLDGPSVAAALRECGVTHVIWVPDSALGLWDEALRSDPVLKLIRPCREGEAIGIAAGLLLGGARPVVLLQCTGLFEAGDALRNVVHDMGLPLFLVVGVRNLLGHRQGTTTDNCPVFTEPIVQAWRLPYTVLDERHTAADLAEAYRRARQSGQAAAVLLAEGAP